MLKLNTFHLKIIATVIMLIDHIAHILIPSSEPAYYIMRIIGRVAAPIFWFCFTEGYRHTSNKGKYATRLAMASIVMMVGNSIMDLIVGKTISITPIDPNIFLTMFFMLVAIECFENAKESLKKNSLGYAPIAVLFCMITGLYAEYGWFAVGSILCFYFIKNISAKCLVFVVLSLILCLIEKNFLQIFMVLSILPIVSYSNEKPRRCMKWFFYVFYPTHLWALMVVARLI